MNFSTNPTVSIVNFFNTRGTYLSLNQLIYPPFRPSFFELRFAFCWNASSPAMGITLLVVFHHLLLSENVSNPFLSVGEGRRVRGHLVPSKVDGEEVGLPRWGSERWSVSETIKADSVLLSDSPSSPYLYILIVQIERKSNLLKSFRKWGFWDFPGSPVAKTPCSQCRGPRFNPWLVN